MMEFEAYASRRMILDNLFVQQALFGAAHSCPSPIGELTISLPSSPGPHAAKEGLAGFSDHSAHSWYEMEVIDLRIDLNDNVKFNGTDADFNTMTVVSDKSSKLLFAAIEAAFDGGYDLWKRTLRWTALAPLLDMSESQTKTSSTVGYGFKVARKSDGAVFRHHGGSVSSFFGGKITQDAWASAGRALANGIAPPAWFDFLFEAIRKEALGEYRAAVVGAAVACETLIRTTLYAALPPITNAAALRVIETASIQGLLTRWPELSEQTKQDCERNGKSAVHKLFDLRNEVMHTGLQDVARLKDIEKLLPQVSKFILAGDSALRTSQALPNSVFPADGALERLTRKI